MPRRFVRYRPYLKRLARNLRNRSTLGEILLWQQLKGKQCLGYDFHRQKPIDRYIVDFYCPILHLVVEVDGSSHDSEEARRRDAVRQRRLEALGLVVLRFEDREVRRDVAAVVGAIAAWIEERQA